MMASWLGWFLGGDRKAVRRLGLLFAVQCLLRYCKKKKIFKGFELLVLELRVDLRILT